MAAPDGYVAPSTSEDLAYIAYFRQACKRHNIGLASADQDEHDFVIRMAEKNFAPETGLTHMATHTPKRVHGINGKDRFREYLPPH